MNSKFNNILPVVAFEKLLLTFKKYWYQQENTFKSFLKAA